MIVRIVNMKMWKVYFHSEHDAIKNVVFDEKPLIDDVEMDMNKFCSVVDEDNDLGRPDQTNNNKEEHKDIEDEPLKVIDNNIFDSFASE